MSEMGIAQLLLRGSKNIDLMRKEVFESLAMIIGLVRTECAINPWRLPGRGNTALIIEGKGCKWHVYQLREGRSSGEVMYVDILPDGGGVARRVFSSGNEWKFTPIWAGYVQLAYENLDEFVEGMAKAFPEILTRELEPFKRAGKLEL